MTSPKEANVAALKAIRTRALRATVYIFEPYCNPPDLSSGTLIETANGRLVVLTAKHCLADYDDRHSEVHIGVLHAPPMKGVIDYWRKHPKADVDVGYILLKGSPEPFRNASVPAELVAKDALDTGREDGVLMVGCPRDRAVLQGREIGVSSLQYEAPTEAFVTNQDGRWTLHWSEGDVTDFYLFEGAPKARQDEARGFLRAQLGERIPLPEPHSMSGGGCWRIAAKHPDRDALWKAEDHLQLVGIQRGYVRADKTVTIEPADRWGTWFADEIDGLPAG